MLPIRRAVLSVYRKDGIVDLARFLAARGVEIYSTGGTERALLEAGVPVVPVSRVTGFPEILDGRVKTLNPRLLGGVLARKDSAVHLQTLEAHGIPAVDLVVCNLYPFEEAVADPGCDVARALENIDVGGPTMIRAAAKNHPSVAVVIDPGDYGQVRAQMEANDGALDAPLRERLAARAFAHTAAYDAAIARWFARAEPFPERVALPLVKVSDLRYGENPHQRAALYAEPGWKGPTLARAEVLAGKEMSFNNYADAEAAVALVRELGGPAAVVVKHANPCGAAVAEEGLAHAYEAALVGDPVSAFGGILAFNRPVDEGVAGRVAERFYEVVLAPDFTPEALERLTRKKNLRLVRLRDMNEASSGGPDWKRLRGAFLASDWDEGVPEGERVVTRRAPTAAEAEALAFARTVCKHVRSNAIVLASGREVVGVGAGQMSRVDSVAIATRKAGARAAGAVLASDAFFPFADGLLAAVEGGVTAVIQPGGSVRDDEVVAAADERGVAMVFTGVRHFRH